MDYKQLKGTPVIQVLSASPSSPPASGYIYLYPKTDNTFYQMDSSGAESAIDEVAGTYYMESKRLLGKLIYQLLKNEIKINDNELLEHLNYIKT